METCDGITPTSLGRGLGLGVSQVPILTRVSPAELTDDPGRVQEHILDGVDTSTMGARHRLDLCAPRNIFYRPPSGVEAYDAPAWWNSRTHWTSGLYWLVDGQVRPER